MDARSVCTFQTYLSLCNNNNDDVDDDARLYAFGVTSALVIITTTATMQPALS